MNFFWILGIAALSGAIALSYEIVWYRAYSLVSWTSPTAFGLLLGAYLIGIALGSAWARYFCTKRSNVQDSHHLALLAGFLAVSNLIGYAVVPMLGRSVIDTHWVASLYLVAIATTFLGAILPLLSHFGVSPDARAGKKLSYIYLANILGSAAGSLLTGFVFMDHLTMRQIHIVLIVAGTTLAGVIWLAAVPKRSRAFIGLGALIGVATGVIFMSRSHFEDIYERLLYKDAYTRDFRFAEVIENRSGVIAVTKTGAVFGSGAYDGQFNTDLLDDRNGIIRAFVGAALRPAPKEILVIGVASGSWTQVFAHHPGLERLTAIEINPGYLELISRHPEVSGILTNPKVSIVVDDGRRWLKRNPDRKFDAIIMNTTWHFRSMATNLLSREFFELARTHLHSGGILYYNTTTSNAAVKTGATVFSHALQYINFLAVSDAPLHMDPREFERFLWAYTIEGKPVLEPSREDHRIALTKILKSFEDIELRDKILERTEKESIITDDNMDSEWHSNRIPRKIDPLSYFNDSY